MMIATITFCGQQGPFVYALSEAKGKIRFMETSRTKNVKRIIFSGIIQKIVNLFIPFLTRTIIIYCMGSLYLGLNGLFSSVLQVLSLAELGVGESIVFSMYKPIAERDVKKVCALLNLYKKVYRIIGIVISVMGILFMHFLPYMINGEIPDDIDIFILYIINLLNAVIGYFFFAHKRSLLNACQRSDLLNIYNTVLSILKCAIQIWILVLWRNYYIYCILAPIFSVVSNLVIEYISRKKYPEYTCLGKVSSEEMRRIKEKISGLFVGKVCYIFRNSFDSIVISAFLGLIVLGKYQNYYYIVTAVSSFVLLFSTSTMASVGNSMAVESQDKNYHDFLKFQLIFMWIAGWCTVCMYCLYQPFMKLWVGEKMMLDFSVVVVCCIYFFTDMMGNLCFVYRQAAGLWNYKKYTPILEATVNLVLNILLVRHWGILGVMLSTIFCQVVINTKWSSGILFQHYFTEQKWSRYIVRLCIFAIITAVGCLITNYICTRIHVDGLNELMYRGGVCIVLPNIIFSETFRFLPEYDESMRFIKEKIFRI
ncbi:MAG: hypothetical protein Q4E73_11425 [Lachnospiraceae bacterium]|nr:hypothetical protein [Lachnospiraceae bacterium]